MAISKNARVGKKGYEEESSCLRKHNYGSGAGMYSKRTKKRANRGKGQTAGSVKCDTCQADWKKKYMAKSSRSYKHREYGAWLEKFWATGYDCMSFEQYKEMHYGTREKV